LGRRTAALPVRRVGITLGLAGVLLGAAVVPGGVGAAAWAAGQRAGWHVVPSPNGARYGDNTLMQVSAEPGSDTWAVGYAGGNGEFRTMIQRWNGARWAVVPSPSVGALNNQLLGVGTVSAADAWAVGYDTVVAGHFGFHRALIEHWNGRTWRVVPAPQPGPRDSDLWG
jgi:hypothetical protein